MSTACLTISRTIACRVSRCSTPFSLLSSAPPECCRGSKDYATPTLLSLPLTPTQACSFAFTRRAARGPPEPEPEWNFTGMRDSLNLLTAFFLASRISACFRASYHCHCHCHFLLLYHCFLCAFTELLSSVEICPPILISLRPLEPLLSSKPPTDKPAPRLSVFLLPFLRLGEKPIFVHADRKAMVYMHRV